MTYFANHSASARIVDNLYCLVELAESERIKGTFLVFRSMNPTSDLLNFYRCHSRIIL